MLADTKPRAGTPQSRATESPSGPSLASSFSKVFPKAATQTSFYHVASNAPGAGHVEGEVAVEEAFVTVEREMRKRGLSMEKGDEVPGDITASMRDLGGEEEDGGGGDKIQGSVAVEGSGPGAAVPEEGAVGGAEQMGERGEGSSTAGGSGISAAGEDPQIAWLSPRMTTDAIEGGARGQGEIRSRRTNHRLPLFPRAPAATTVFPLSHTSPPPPPHHQRQRHHNPLDQRCSSIRTSSR